MIELFFRKCTPREQMHTFSKTGIQLHSEGVAAQCLEQTIEFVSPVQSLGSTVKRYFHL